MQSNSLQRSGLAAIFGVLAITVAVIACGGGGGGTVAGGIDVAAGKALFGNTCATCHGPKGEGVPNLGKDMRGNEWIKGETDEALVQFLKEGRKATDPLNATGIDMPPKGGNANLTDADLEKIVAFMRTL